MPHEPRTRTAASLAPMIKHARGPIVRSHRTPHENHNHGKKTPVFSKRVTGVSGLYHSLCIYIISCPQKDLKKHQQFQGRIVFLYFSEFH